MSHSSGVFSAGSILSDDNVEDTNTPSNKQPIQSILLVDPDPDFSSTVTDYLKLFGYNICFRTDIDEALEYCQSSFVDVVFLADSFDFLHPIDVLRRFKKATPDSLIAILANKGDDQLAVELLKSGADDYLSRRVKEQDILTAIAALLENLSTNDNKPNTNNVSTRPQQSNRNLKDKFASANSKPFESLTSDSSNQKSATEQENAVATNAVAANKEQDVSLKDAAQFKDLSQTDTHRPSLPNQPEEKAQLENATVSDNIPEIRQLPGVLVLLNKHLEIIDANRKFTDLLGYSNKALIEQPIDKYIPKQIYSEFVSELKAIGYKRHSNKHSDGVNSLPFEIVLVKETGEGVSVKCQVSFLTQTDSENRSNVQYLLSLEDLSLEKEKQAQMLYESMWNNLLRAFAHRFINLKLEEFSKELTSVVSETACFFKLDRVSIYLLDKQDIKAKVYLEWLKNDVDSLKQFSKKIDIDKSLPEFQMLLSGKAQLLSPQTSIKSTAVQQCSGLSEHYAQVGANTTLVLPITKQASVIGWIALDYQARDDGWQLQDLAMVEPLAQLFSEAFTRRAAEEQRKVTYQKLSENHGKLSEHAFLDGLTKLANRRYFDKVLESEVRRASREQSNIALLFCDVDYFKAYNDTYGHIKGDSCLQSIAAIFKKEFQRAGDFVARFGGEEFAIILSGSLANDAYDSAEKFRQHILSENIENSGAPLGKISMSIGIASVIAPEPNDSEKLLSKADKALYKAKANGRNRTEVSPFSPR
jgi:diguanylate cyclase (GGDEF)-like protein